MALFRRKRRQAAEPTTDAEGAAADEDTTEGGATAGGSTDEDVAAVPVLGDHAAADLGPFDVADVPTTQGLLDFGSLLLPAIGGLSLSVEVDEASGVLSGVRIPIASSVLQLQAFAAPRSTGLWGPIREEIAEAITGGGGTAATTEGPYGAELHVGAPSGPGGGPASMRFLGVDGPRWFLRGVISGPAAADPQLAQPFVDLMRLVVVVRGDEPMAPRELLPLRLPVEPAAEPTADAEAAADGTTAPVDGLGPFQRGPEITEIR